MDPIHFETVLGADRIIHPPAGVRLPEGAIEVTVRPIQLSDAKGSSSPDASNQWLLDFAMEAERLATSLPSDMAEHHDHYAHGAPLS